MAALVQRNCEIWASAASMALKRVLARDQADRVLPLGMRQVAVVATRMNPRRRSAR